MRLKRKVGAATFALAAALLLGAAAGRAGGHPTGWRHAGRTTFAYGIYEYDFASFKAFAGFRQKADGRLTPFRLWVNSNNAPDLPEALTASPDGRFLYTECGTDREYPGAHTYFIQYRVLPTGQLREVRRFGLGYAGNRLGLGDATALVFLPTGHNAYALGGSRHGSGSVLQLRVDPAGRLLWPPTVTAPCGPERYGLEVSDSGRNLYALDPQEGRLWQYALTAKGRPVPLRPPWLPISPQSVGPVLKPGDVFGPFVTPGGVCAADGRAVYHFRAGPGGALTPLPSFPLAAGDIPTAIAPLSGGALAVQLLTRLLILRAGPGGVLVRVSSLPLGGDTVCRVDPSGRFLYVQGLHTRIYVFRIRPGGRLIPVHTSPIRTGTEITDLVFVRR